MTNPTLQQIAGRFGTADPYVLASCALSFFRNRHALGRRRRGRLVADLSVQRDNKRLARDFAQAARVAGWRGSIVAEALRRAKLGGAR